MITKVQRNPNGNLMVDAGAGVLVWLLWGVVAQPSWTAVLLMLSPFVLLPLGLRLAVAVGPTTPKLASLATRAPIVAVFAAASFLLAPGLLAALLSAPWLSFTVYVALNGFVRLLSRPNLRDPGIGTDAGLIFLAVGGASLTISRAGLNPLGFSDAIVQLTAVHFHYAGFALPIVAGIVASRLGQSVVVPLAVIAGVPLTALGITIGGWLEWVAATVMALAGMAVAALLIGFSRGLGRTLARWLIAAAGVALFAGMCLALGWSWSIRFGWQFYGLDSMAATHGSLNALGFGLLGLVGLNLVVGGPGTGAVEAGDAGETIMHLGRPTGETLNRLAVTARGHELTSPVGVLRRPAPNGFNHKSWRRVVEHGDFAAVTEGIERWRGHEAAGITRSLPEPRIRVGETLALAIPVGPISVTATSRIVEVIDEPDRYGFTYATLPHHPVDGEESFIVTRHDDGRVEVVVTAIWRSAAIANRVCPPLTRLIQNRTINQYLDGLAASRRQAPWVVPTTRKREQR